MESIEYDDRNLQQLFAEMDPKRRLQAIKGGFRREANQVRKTAINNLRNSIRSDKDLEKGVRAIVFKRKAGFRVTVGTKKANKEGKGGAGFHTNKQGVMKPVLIWTEDGTSERRTKSSGGKRANRKRAAHSTGRMKRYGFMTQTLNGVRDGVTNNLHNMVTESVQQIADKHGCK